MTNDLWPPACTEYIDDIARGLRENRVLVVLGAGAVLQSTQWATKPDPRVWVGLIEHGIFFLRGQKVDVSRLENDLGRVCKAQASQSTSDSIAKELTQIAGNLQSELNKCSAFPDWLKCSVGSLCPTKPNLFLDALRQLGAPLLTTNYDEVLELYYSIEGTTWLDRFAVERFTKETSHAIFHFHGLWRWPRSIIFSNEDYERIKNDKFAQSVIRGLRHRYNFLYIGCGAGVADPNIRSFRKWATECFNGLGYTDWMLIKGDQRPVQPFKDEPLAFVSYTDHGKLPAILEEISAAAWKRRQLPRYTLSTSVLLRDDDDNREKVESLVRMFNSDLHLQTAAKQFLEMQEVMIRAGLGQMRIDLGTRLQKHDQFQTLRLDLKLNIWLSLAQAFQDQHFPEHVIAVITTAWEELQAAHEKVDIQQLFALLQTCAAGLTEAGRFQEAVKLARYALNKINREITNRSMKARNHALALQTIALAAKRAGDINAECYLDAARTAAIEADDLELIAGSLINLAEFKATNMDFGAALKHLEEAKSKIIMDADNVCMAEVLQTQAEIFTTVGDRRAVEVAQEALTIGNQSRHQKIILQARAAVVRALMILEEDYAPALEDAEAVHRSLLLGSPETRVYLAFLQWVAALLDRSDAADNYKDYARFTCDQAKHRGVCSVLVRDVTAVVYKQAENSTGRGGPIAEEISDHRIASIRNHLNAKKPT